ncbi:MAG: PAS domain S-box protein, partial [Chthoniobacteraceae bacterium]
MNKKTARLPARATVAAGRNHRPAKAADASAALLDEMARQRNQLELQNEELRRAHAKLEISHQRFSELHEQAPVGYLTFDAQGCIRAINVAATALLGVARAYVIGKPFIVYVEKADRKAFLDHLWKVRRATSTVAADLRLATRTGGVVRVQMTTGRHRDTEGHSSLFLSAIEDVTVLRDASVTAAYLASIVESSQEQIISYSPNGMIRSWNRGAQRILGYSAAEIVGKDVSVIVPEDCRAEFARNFLAAKAGGVMPSHDTFRRHRDGSLVPMALTFSPITEAGKVIAVIV